MPYIVYWKPQSQGLASPKHLALALARIASEVL